MKRLDLPKVIGHRGVAGYAPENTLSALHAAADMGLRWVEFDVKLTKDGIPILFHDETLERTTNGNGLVAEMLYSDLAELDAGFWFGESHIGEPIPTLEEAVEVLLERDLGVNVEIKPCPGREKETAEATLDLLSQIWDDPARILISSFQHVSLESALDMLPDWPRGLLVRDLPENWKDLAKYLEASTVNLNGRICKEEEILEILDSGYSPLAYTINESALAEKLYGWGCVSLFSDTPDLL